MSQDDAIISIEAGVPDWLQSVIDIPDDPPHEEPDKLQRIPPTLLENNEDYHKKYYTPMVVPLGPIHCRNIDGQSMKDLKRKAMKQLAERVKDRVSIGDVYASVEEKLLSARNFYSCDIIKFFQDDREWCELMFLDGCFVVEFIRHYVSSLIGFGGRSFFNMKKYDTAMVLRDLCLYENQLPFEVLDALADAFRCKERFHSDLNELLFELPFMLTSSVPAPTFLDHIDNCFGIKFRRRVKRLYQVPHHGKIVIPAAAHLLQHYLIRLNIIIFGRKAAYSPQHKGRRRRSEADDAPTADTVAPTVADSDSDPDSDTYFTSESESEVYDPDEDEEYLRDLEAIVLVTAGAPRPRSTVTELKKVGIKCSGSTSLSDISFYSNMLSGKLFLPQLTFNRWSKTLILNLAAYEFLCGSKYGSSGISSYLSSIGTFIHGEEDVKELRARGLVQLNHKDDDDHSVVDFFRYIATYHEPNPKVIKRVKRQISTYCESKRLPLRVARAELKQRYFSGPWNFLVFLAIIFTVSMTIIQTVATCIQTFKKN